FTTAHSGGGPTRRSHRQAGLCRYTLDALVPSALSQPSRASVTLSEATAPVKLPTCHGPGGGVLLAVRASHDAGWYFTVASAQASAWASTAPTYATQRCATTNDKLQ